MLEQEEAVVDIDELVEGIWAHMEFVKYMTWAMLAIGVLILLSTLHGCGGTVPTEHQSTFKRKVYDIPPPPRIEDMPKQ